nr:ATP synthase subunit I [Desulfobacterales bacterium]
MNQEKRLVRFVYITSWAIFLVFTIGGFIFKPGLFAWGVMAGGVIVMTNFHLLYRTIKKALNPSNLVHPKSVLGKYYVRFFLSAIIIFILISDHYVDPIGLIVGLSVVVISIFITLFYELKKLISKEAI